MSHLFFLLSVLPIVPVIIPLAIDRDFMVTYQMMETVEPVLD